MNASAAAKESLSLRRRKHLMVKRGIPSRWVTASILLSLAMLGWLAPAGTVHAQIACPAGQILVYRSDGAIDSTLSPTCNNGNYPANVLAHTYPSLQAGASAIAGACNGSQYGVQVTWGSPYLSGGGIEWYQPGNLNGSPYTSLAEFGPRCESGYYVAVPPSTAKPLPIPATGSTCSACRTGAVHVGHPIDPASGNEFESALDYRAGDPRFRWTRVYNSGSVSIGALGARWQDNFAASISNAFGAYQSSGAIAGYVSDVYTTASDACIQGWSRIAAASAELAPATADASASFNTTTNTCQLSTGQTIPVYETADTSLDVLGATTYPALMAVNRPDGAVFLFQCSQGSCTAPADVPLHLTPTANGYALVNEDGDTETYNSNGALVSITNKNGYQRTLAYNSAGQLQSVTDNHGRALRISYQKNLIASVAEPDGGVIQYGYDDYNRLITVTYPDKSALTYTYASSVSDLLTGVIDEASNPYLISVDPQFGISPCATAAAEAGAMITARA